MKFDEVKQKLKTEYNKQLWESLGIDLKKKYKNPQRADKKAGCYFVNVGEEYKLVDKAINTTLDIFDYIQATQGIDDFVGGVKFGASQVGLDIDEQTGEKWKSCIRGKLHTKAKEKGYKVDKILSCIRFDYKTVAGEYGYSKYRVDYITDGEKDKSLWSGIHNFDENTATIETDLVKNFKSNSKKCFMYGDFKKYKELETIYLVEGEKCVDAMHKQGYKNVITAGNNTDGFGNEKYYEELKNVFKNTNLIVLLDNDTAGESLKKNILNCLGGVCNTIKILTPYKARNKSDIADFFADGGSKEVLDKKVDNELLASFKSNKKYVAENILTYSIEYRKDTHGNLIKDENGQPIIKSKKVDQTSNNWLRVLENDNFLAGKITFNAFLERRWQRNISLDRNTHELSCGIWSDSCDSIIYSYIQENYKLKNRKDYEDAINNYTNTHYFNELQDELKTLTYDGKSEYIEDLFIDYLGIEDTPYNREVSKLLMMAAVTRAFLPGNKYDYCIVLAGEQGTGKSTFIRKLALKNEWFDDNLGDIEDKDTKAKLLSKWIIELGELKELTRGKTNESIKGFISAQADDIRLHYGRYNQIYKRHCIFVGTTNKMNFLSDRTGNRRWIVLQIPPKSIKRNKDIFSNTFNEDIKKAWGQAVYLYEQAYQKDIIQNKKDEIELQLSADAQKVAEQLQDSYMLDDGEDGQIIAYLEDKTEVSILELWDKALGHEDWKSKKPNKFQQSDIVDILINRLHWKRQDGRQRTKNRGAYIDYGLQYIYMKPTEQTEQTLEELKRELQQIRNREQELMLKIKNLEEKSARDNKNNIVDFSSKQINLDGFLDFEDAEENPFEDSNIK